MHAHIRIPKYSLANMPGPFLYLLINTSHMQVCNKINHNKEMAGIEAIILPGGDVNSSSPMVRINSMYICMYCLLFCIGVEIYLSTHEV